ncbi:MAG: GNAT family N-acetyltransferase [Clostridia bacterium]|nr:GNAT family N-acetyltransferase [Clostridia bacterium]
MRYEKTVLLKNGTACVIRAASGADAEAVIDCFHVIRRETDFMMAYPGENTLLIEPERAFLDNRLADDRAVFLCAEVDGKIVGTAGVDPLGRWEKLRHRASFGIGVKRDWWGLGIGRALTESCIECAKASGYTQLELEVVADNTAALSLYRSCGFTEYGRNERGFLLRDGSYYALLMMKRDL